MAVAGQSVRRWLCLDLSRTPKAGISKRGVWGELRMQVWDVVGSGVRLETFRPSFLPSFMSQIPVEHLPLCKHGGSAVSEQETKSLLPSWAHRQTADK